MHGHSKECLAGTGMLLCYVTLLLDTVVLLWGYQVGQWLRRAADQPQPQRKDGR